MFIFLLTLDNTMLNFRVCYAFQSVFNVLLISFISMNSHFIILPPSIKICLIFSFPLVPQNLSHFTFYHFW